MTNDIIQGYWALTLADPEGGRGSGKSLVAICFFRTAGTDPTREAIVPLSGLFINIRKYVKTYLTFVCEQATKDRRIRPDKYLGSHSILC